VKNLPVGVVKNFPYLSVGLMILATTGCATKKFVRTTVAPLEARVAQVEKQNSEQSASIDGLENDVSRTKERALDAESRANSASQEAQAAGNKAGQASSTAENARLLAARSINRVGDLERFIEDRDKLQPVTSQNVLFPFGSSMLNQEAKALLDEIAGQLQGKDRFVLELQGFTDRTGRANYNLSLSQQRAQAVARYLAVTHKIPLRNIHLIGAGSESPVADNRNRSGRRLNRRVEVRVFAPSSEQQVATAVSAPE